MKFLVIGSRGSQLALWQAHHVGKLLQQYSPGLQVRIEILKTTGDRLSESLLRQWGTAKGLFVKEIEEALQEGSVDLAVHSLKDVPTELPPGLCLGAILQRDDPRDALISRHPLQSYRDLPSQAVVGTSSLRRRLQLEYLRPDVTVAPLRGNVDTRLRKMEESNLDGIILAAAGLDRLGLAERVSCLFQPEEMMPAVGQGALAVEIRCDDEDTRRLVEPLEHEDTRLSTDAERAFLKRMGGGCQVPMGAYARVEEGEGFFSAFLGNPDGTRILREKQRAGRSRLVELSLAVADRLLEQGGETILKEFDKAP